MHDAAIPVDFWCPEDTDVLPRGALASEVASTDGMAVWRHRADMGAIVIDHDGRPAVRLFRDVAAALAAYDAIRAGALVPQVVTRLVRYHGMDVLETYPIHQLAEELDSRGLVYDRVTVDGRPMLAVGSRLRLLYDAEAGVFAALVRHWDTEADAPSNDWTPAEWGAYTSNAHWYASRMCDGIRRWAHC